MQCDATAVRLPCLLCFRRATDHLNCYCDECAQRRDVTQKCLRRRSADSVPALEQALGEFLDRRNENPKPLQWKATAVEILRKTKRAWATLIDRYGVKKPSAALASIKSIPRPLPETATN